MLSLILARLFKLSFYLIFFPAAGIIISQVMQKPLSFSTGEGSVMTLGNPGIIVSSNKTSQLEKAAPDSTVRTRVLSKDGIYIGGGDHKLNSFLAALPDSFYTNNISPEDTIGMTIQRDTQITALWSESWDPIDKVSYADFVTLDDGRINVNTIKSYKGHTKKTSDTLDNMIMAKIFEKTKQRINPYVMQEENAAKQSLRIMPANLAQVIGFVIYDVIRLSSVTLLLLIISGLFKNFYWKEYFSVRNVRLLKVAGWLLLLPQLLSTIFYWTFLINIHPVKVHTSFTGEVDFVAQYELNSGVDTPMIILGLALLILSYIFRDGMRLKEEQALTV